MFTRKHSREQIAATDSSVPAQHAQKKTKPMYNAPTRVAANSHVLCTFKIMLLGTLYNTRRVGRGHFIKFQVQFAHSQHRRRHTQTDDALYEELVCHNSQPDTENVSQQGVV